MRRVGHWLDERLDLAGLRRTLLDREVPTQLTWWHTLGSATLTVFLVLVVTGVVLATYYSPSPDHAYDSIRYIQSEVRGGALLRGMHHWSASAMVVLVVMHMLRVFVMGAYKYPREVNWVLGVGLFVVVMAFSFTGYLLPWDQKAYWATQVGTSMAGTAPGIGGAAVTLLRGGSELGAGTLTRFYAFHVLWLPGTLIGLVVLHLAVVVRQGIAPRPRILEEGSPDRTSAPEYAPFYRQAYAQSKRGGQRFWPDVLVKDAVVAALVVTAIVVLAATAGAGLEPPADPTDTSYVPRPEWYFLPLFQLLKLVPGSMEGAVAVGVPAVVIVVLLALPFFDRGSRRNVLHRPVALGALALSLGGSGFLLGSAVRDLGPTVPPEVGRPLTSKERAGKALYGSQQCNSCHRIGDQGGDEGPALTDIGLRHSVAWLHSLIEDPARFRGDTTKMPSFGPPNLSHEQVEELAHYMASLRGGAGANIEPQYQDTFPQAKVPR